VRKKQGPRDPDLILLQVFHAQLAESFDPGRVARVIRLYLVRLIKDNAPERCRLQCLLADKLADFGWQPSDDAGDAVPAQQNHRGGC
jgi:hypothetical protein